MRTFQQWYSAVPIHWKLTIWSALLLCMLFAANNMTQYFFVERWMVKQEENRIQRDMRELLNLLLAKEIAFEPDNLSAIRNELERANVRDGMIRIISATGEPILVAADNMPQAWIASISPDKENRSSMYVQDGMLVMRSPITIFQFQGMVEIVRSMGDIHRLITAFYEIMTICCIGAIVLSAFGGRLLARQLMKPLQAMNETMRKVKQNGLQERMPVNGAKDDIAALKTMFNGMMDQVERSFHQQKQFVEDASHELRTPIAVIEGHLALLQRWGKDDPAVLEDSLRISLEELDRLKGLIEELLMLSRAEKSGEDDWDADCCEHPEETISGVVHKVRVVHPNFQFKLQLEMLKGLKLLISDRHLGQIILILLDNAVKYSGDSREIVISAAISDALVSLSVIDFGIGIAQQELPYVWDRFYRADKARSGSSRGYGLGLSIAKQLAEGYKGTIQLKGNQAGGTTALLTLPIATKSSI